METTASNMNTIVLRHGPRHVLVLLPKTYQELLAITRSVFGPALGSTVLFETSDLDICQDVAVEIHPDAWEAIALTVSSVVVKNQDLVVPRESQHGEDGGAPQHSHTRGKASLTPERAHKTASKSPNQVAQSENGLSGPATSLDDIRDSLPTDDLGDEELGSYEDDFDITPALRKGKGKSRARIESDGEDDEEDGLVEGPSVARLPSYTPRNTKTEPSFSIVPSPPKRSAPAASPQRSIRGGARGLFSPRVMSALINPIPQLTPSNEEKEAKSPAPNPTQAAPDAPPSPETTAPNPAPPKDTQRDNPAKLPKFKPQLKFQMSPTQTHAKPPSGDKMLITIRHLPTENENKFRVKGTHSVGRVLTSACAAFGLNAEGYVYSLGPAYWVLFPLLYELTFYLVPIR
ncbi:hypothetical protein BJV78DRAFT_161177 [Lactifluus subvellereus]|nr:hypothetical protein BJV78DRAFT_161177 [Lactifluus subvellereus]